MIYVDIYIYLLPLWDEIIYKHRAYNKKRIKTVKTRLAR